MKKNPRKRAENSHWILHTYREPSVKCYTSQVYGKREVRCGISACYANKWKGSVPTSPLLISFFKRSCRNNLYHPRSPVTAFGKQIAVRRHYPPQRGRGAEPAGDAVTGARLQPARAPLPRAAAPRHRGGTRHHVPVPRWAARGSEGWQGRDTAAHPAAGSAARCPHGRSHARTVAGTAQQGAAPHGQPRKSRCQHRTCHSAGRSWGRAETPQTCFGASVYIFLPGT